MAPPDRREPREPGLIPFGLQHSGHLDLAQLPRQVVLTFFASGSGPPVILQWWRAVRLEVLGLENQMWFDSADAHSLFQGSAW